MPHQPPTHGRPAGGPCRARTRGRARQGDRDDEKLCVGAPRATASRSFLRCQRSEASLMKLVPREKDNSRLEQHKGNECPVRQSHSGAFRNKGFPHQEDPGAEFLYYPMT